MLTKRLCREVTVNNDEDSVESDMIVDQGQTDLNNQTSRAVDNLKSAMTYV